MIQKHSFRVKEIDRISFSHSKVTMGDSTQVPVTGRVPFCFIVPDTGMILQVLSVGYIDTVLVDAIHMNRVDSAIYMGGLSG